MGTGIHVCFDLAAFQLGNKVVHEECGSMALALGKKHFSWP